MRRIKLFIASLAMALVPALALVPATVHAQNDIANTVSCGATGDIGAVTTGCAVTDTTNNVNGAIKFAIRIFQFVVGIISIIMIILGGLKYITSGGEAGNITSAKNTILYAVVGLIVVVLAQTIVQFVLTKANSL